ncbi:MAG: hypothetical protein ACKN80_03885, partial [Actinomycetales bacterium]
MSRLSGIAKLSKESLAKLSSSDRLVAPLSAFPQLIAARAAEKKLVLVTHSSKRAGELVKELGAYIDAVREFPSW